MHDAPGDNIESNAEEKRNDNLLEQITSNTRSRQLRGLLPLRLFENANNMLTNNLMSKYNNETDPDSMNQHANRQILNTIKYAYFLQTIANKPDRVECMGFYSKSSNLREAIGLFHLTGNTKQLQHHLVGVLFN